MTVYAVKHFEKLKGLVLQKGGYNDLSPADCRALAITIFKVTNMQVSETTLKRVYGFAYSKFKPSLFTLNAMARYCDFIGWADFCNNNEKASKPAKVADVCWENIKESAHKITGFTLQVLKNKSGIPYSQTIKRKFIDDHLGILHDKDYIATSLVAPAGYGKTLALCHWIEERLQQNDSGKTNDIILFFSSNALINIFLNGKDINEWILSLLGYGTESDFSTLLDAAQKHDGNFYLVIDGLDDHMFKNEQFDLLLEHVLNIFLFYQFHSCFRLILTMRTATWINHRHKIEHAKEKWFEGFVNANDDHTNMPLFNINEIRELCTNINPGIKNFISIEAAENFNHPLYFQFYYQQHKQNFSLNNVDHVSIYELVSSFVLTKIYLGSHAAEKTLIVKELIEAMDFGAQKFEVHKYVLNDTIRKYHAAYNDLLGIGFIREINKSADMRYNAVIQFCNENFLNYSIARTLLFKHDNQFDLTLITELNTLFKSERKLQLLKWCIVYAIKNGQQESFNSLAETSLDLKDRSELILFLGDMLEKMCASSTKTEAIMQYFKQDCTDELFNYFFGLELMNSTHKKTLQTLLKFELSTEKKIYVYTSLAMIAIRQLDMTKLEEQLINLKKIPSEHLQEMAINPLSCLDTIYYYCKYGILKKEAIAQLTKFYFQSPNNKQLSNYESTDEMLYLLGLYTLAICNKPVKVLRCINVIEKASQTNMRMSPCFRFLLMCMYADACIALNKIADAKNIYGNLLAFYEQEKAELTAFADASFCTLKTKVQVYETQNSGMEMFNKLLACLSKQTDFRLIQLHTLFFILNNQSLLKATPADMKYVNYEFTKLMRENDFSEELFQKHTARVA